MKVKKCSERLPKELEKRLKEIREALEDEEKYDEYFEGILGISKRIVFTVDLSWGGPADGFIITVDPETREIEEIEYYFHDWFDGATKKLEGEEFELVSEMFNYLAESF